MRVRFEILFEYNLYCSLSPGAESLLLILIDLRILFVIQGFDNVFILRLEIVLKYACLLTTLLSLL